MILDCDEILEGRLWVGSYIRAEEVGFLWRLGITAVLSLQSDRDFEDYGIALQPLSDAYAAAGIEFRRIPVMDFSQSALRTALPLCVDELADALSAERAKVYVHCTAGVNRAPTVAAAYLMRVQGLSARDACNHVCARRHCSPYLDLLLRYEAELQI